MSVDQRIGIGSTILADLIAAVTLTIPWLHPTPPHLVKAGLLLSILPMLIAILAFTFHTIGRKRQP